MDDRSPELTRTEVLRLVGAGPEEGLHPTEVTMALGLPRDMRPRVRRFMRQLARRGDLEQQGRNFVLGAKAQEALPTLTGRIRLESNGSGSIKDDQGQIRLQQDTLVGLMNGDEVLVEVLDHGGGRRRGRVLEIVQRAHARLTGTLGEHFTLEVDRPRLGDYEVHVSGTSGAQPGEAVSAEILSYPTHDAPYFTVHVIRSLGRPGELSTEVERELERHAIEQTFSDDVTDQATAAAKAPLSVDAREDLRDLAFVTIDPADARDHDDAVYAEVQGDGSVRVWVAIADVSHYVAENSPLDTAALSRGCTIYLPDRAIPMLPSQLSGDQCSLLADQDRQAMVVRFDVDSDGNMDNIDWCAALIRCRASLNYKGVARTIAGDKPPKDHLGWIDALKLLQRVSHWLHRRRNRQGSLELDLPEARVVFGQSFPDGIETLRSSRSDPAIRDAYKIIEALMVAANEAVGELFAREGRDVLWRIHEGPDPDKLTHLAEVLGALGHDVDPEPLGRPAGVRKLLKRLAQANVKRGVLTLVLRSLKQARYSINNLGHFGLASDTYLHFTSPIRRYPDLMVHRLLKQFLAERGGKAGDLSTIAAKRDTQRLVQIADQASRRERLAIDIERNVMSIYGAAVMQRYIGHHFVGEVVGVASFGAFLSLEQPAVEGLLPLHEVDQYFHHDVRTEQLIGERDRRIRLGDQIEVECTRAEPRLRQIDFRPLWSTGAPAKKQTGKRGRNLPGRRGRRKR